MIFSECSAKTKESVESSFTALI